MGSGGHDMQPFGVQRMNCQMIPTPGFNNNVSNQGLLSAEASNNSGMFSMAESATTVSHGQHQKVHVGGQNNSGHIFHGQSTDMIHSGLQQKSFAFSNGAPPGGFSMVGNNSQLSNGAGTSDNATPYGNSPKISLPHIDHYQRTPLQGTYENLVILSILHPFKLDRRKGKTRWSDQSVL